MKLDAFALLIAGPVCEQAETPMDHDHGRYHVAGDAESGDTTEKTENQAAAPEEFGADGHKCERGRDVRLLRDETHDAGEHIAATPPEPCLRAVREDAY